MKGLGNNYSLYKNVCKMNRQQHLMFFNLIIKDKKKTYHSYYLGGVTDFGGVLSAYLALNLALSRYNSQ